MADIHSISDCTAAHRRVRGPLTALVLAGGLLAPIAQAYAQYGIIRGPVTTFAAMPGLLPGLPFYTYPTGWYWLGTVTYGTAGTGIRQAPGDLLPEWFPIPVAIAGLTALHGVSRVVGLDDELVMSFPDPPLSGAWYFGGFDPIMNDFSGVPVAPPVDWATILGPPGASPHAAVFIDQTTIRMMLASFIVKTVPRPPGAFISAIPIRPTPTDTLVVTTSGGVVEFTTSGSSGAFGFAFDANGTPLVPFTAAPPIRRPQEAPGFVQIAAAPNAHYQIIGADTLGIVSVSPPGQSPPQRLTMSAPAPNPFHGGTRLTIGSPLSSRAHAEVRDVAGRLVRNLGDIEVPAGREVTISWDGRTGGGSRAPSGLYFVVAVVGGQRVSRPCVLIP